MTFFPDFPRFGMKALEEDCSHPGVNDGFLCCSWRLEEVCGTLTGGILELGAFFAPLNHTKPGNDG